MLGRLAHIGVTVVSAAMLACVLIGNPLDAAALDQSPPPADSLVAAALNTAQREHKVVWIEFGASWCTWCKKFETFVHAAEVTHIITSNYVLVNLTVHEADDKKALENAGGLESMNKWGGAKSGLPFYVFLNAAGEKLADSNAMSDGTNIGFPATAEELQRFVGLIDRTAPRLGKAEREKVVDYLNKLVHP